MMLCYLLHKRLSEEKSQTPPVVHVYSDIIQTAGKQDLKSPSLRK